MRKRSMGKGAKGSKARRTGIGTAMLHTLWTEKDVMAPRYAEYAQPCRSDTHRLRQISDLSAMETETHDNRRAPPGS